jgi:6-pyruvoyltetrahydropterin/6-carboxytetrahydropterin synthase
MELTLYTEGWYDASHHLENYEGKCANKHGHTYKICVWVKGEESKLNKAGILWDFGNIKKVIEELDHNDLTKLFN